MGDQERVNIYIDGGNFHHLVLKKLGIGELDFDFDGFVNFLANGRSMVEMGKRFYVGTVREQIGDIKSREAMAKQTTLFTSLRGNKWEIKTSKLRSRTEKIVIDRRVDGFQDILQRGVSEIKVTKNREKGIDVKLAVDLIVGAVDGKYDTAIIVSSDTDLVPAMDLVKIKFAKKVEYIGFSIPSLVGSWLDTKPSQGMITHSNAQRILVESDIRKFIKPSQSPLIKI